MPLSIGDKIPLEAVRRLFIELYFALAAVSPSTANRAATDMLSLARTRLALLAGQGVPVVVQLRKTRGGRGAPSDWKLLGLEYCLVGNPHRHTTDVLKDVMINRLKHAVLARHGPWGAQQEQAVSDAIDKLIEDSAALEPDLKYVEGYVRGALMVVEGRLNKLEDRQRVLEEKQGALETQQAATTRRLDDYGQRLARLEHHGGLGADA